MEVVKYGRYWKVVDTDGALVCLTVYKRGALEVVKRMQALDDAQQWQDVNGPAKDVAGEVVPCTLF